MHTCIFGCIKNKLQQKRYTNKKQHTTHLAVCFFFYTTVVFHAINKNHICFSSLKNTGGIGKSVDFSI